MKKLYSLFVLAITASLVLAACGGGTTAQPKDLLEAIKQSGYILISTDPNYEPQSFLNTDTNGSLKSSCVSAVEECKPLSHQLCLM